MVQIVRIANEFTTLHSAERIGAKAANLARMAALGLPVPPAFVLPVELCSAVVAGDSHAEGHLLDALAQGITFLENATGKRFGDARRPLLVSVRSGAAQSMPGMLATVLDVGCTSEAVRGLVRLTGNPRFAWDCRRRFLEGYAEIVLGLDPATFAVSLADVMVEEAAKNDRDLDGEALERVASTYQALIEKHNRELCDDAAEQLTRAARAVYHSWMGERARLYRRLENLDHLTGTAVTVQAMVFGNTGLTSAAGVAFSRDPSTGSPRPVIDVLFDAQGEDIVSGRRTPENEDAIVRSLPAVAGELRQVLQRLEHVFGDVQDVEFTIEAGRLWILQTRAATRTPRAALQITIDLVHEGLIAPEEGLRRLDNLDLEALAHTRLVGADNPIVHGIGASAGIAIGRAAFDSTSAERLAHSGEPVILIRPDTSTADVAGFAVSSGIVTALGGRTAHAALVARQMGKPCVVGCNDIEVDVAARRAQFGDVTVNEGDWISIEGNSGSLYLGRHDVVIERPHAELAEVEHWRAAAETAGARKSAAAINKNSKIAPCPAASP
jgi:pyruvate,orthophosphate dikinase